MAWLVLNLENSNNVGAEPVTVRDIHPQQRGVSGALPVFRLLRREAGGIGITDVLVIVLVADAVQNAMANQYKSLTEGLAQLREQGIEDLRQVRNASKATVISASFQAASRGKGGVAADRVGVLQQRWKNFPENFSRAPVAFTGRAPPPSI